jgi:hypothetical protein
LRCSSDTPNCGSSCRSHEHARDQDRGRDNGERLQARHNGDHDAAVAEAAGDVGREIALQPRHLDAPARPAQPPERAPTTSIVGRIGIPA